MNALRTRARPNGRSSVLPSSSPKVAPRSNRVADAYESTPTGLVAPLAAGSKVWSSAIAEASVLRRGEGPEGTKPHLTQWTRERLQRFFAGAPAVTQRRLEVMLGSFQRDNAQVARALMLRAIAARIPELEQGRALTELAKFGRTIAALDVEALSSRGTVLDLDSTKNTHHFDPLALWSKRGTIRPVGQGDARGDNDGLFQRFTASCGTTVVQMVLCEADPLASFAVHQAGLHSDRIDDAPSRFQQVLLEAHGGIAVGRRVAQIRSMLRNAVGRLVMMREVTEQQAAAFRSHVEDGQPSSPAAERVLRALRERYDGLPSAPELTRLRAAFRLPEADAGIDANAMEQILLEQVTPLTGVVYESTRPPEGFARGQCWRHLDRVEKALRQGLDVPFGISEPGHWMVMTHVKGRRPHRSFLVSDPDGGRTAWVRERDLIKGTFADRQFHLNTAAERPYVDCFLLPSP